jgi:5'-nucleotidase
MKLSNIACGIALSLAAGTACASTTTVKLIALNDFHGNLQSPGKFNGLDAGGVDVIAAYVERLKARNPLNAVVSAGDLIGASPLVSALFHDEGTIETMNRLGLEINAVGNHEFDDGKNELLRMQNGGCHPSDTQNSCKGAEVGTPVPFEGAKFQFLAANVRDKATKKTLFPAYVVKKFKGIPVAFIGLTLKETPSIVTPSGVAGLAFSDEAAEINKLAKKLRTKRIQSIVVLIHQGGVQTDASDINACTGGLEGSPIKAIVNKLDDSVDLVISGHTHAAYICQIANKAGRTIPVTSANALGRVLTDIDLSIDTASRDVVAVAAHNLVVDRTAADVTPNAGIKAIVDNYAALATPVTNRVIGSITADITKTQNDAGESALGDVIADAQLEATHSEEFGGAVAAFMNPGGIRADLTFASGGAGEGAGNVTYGEAFTVQPFGNSLVSLTLTGAQIKLLLEQQFMGCTQGYPASDTAGQPFDRILQVSEGFSYAWNSTAAPCKKVVPGSIRINGEKMKGNAKYRVTVNNFMADGGDKFYVLKKGTKRLGGAQDIDAFEAYLKAHAPVAPGAQNRIEKVR